MSRPVSGLVALPLIIQRQPLSKFSAAYLGVPFAIDAAGKDWAF
jgi:hypothetical protein